jgi:tetratricopeptide (TPR) repeat protein
MVAEAGAEISYSLLRLRRLLASFSDPPKYEDLEERSLLRLARLLGAVAVPSCVRELSASDEQRWRWAYRLLAYLAGETALRVRVIVTLRRLVAGAAEDSAKVRAAALLVDLGESPPDTAKLSDPVSARRRALGELAGHLRSPEEVARAADYVLASMTSGEVSCFLDDLVEAAPVAAVGLIEELLLRDDVEDRLRGELRGLRAPMVCGPRSRPLRRVPAAVKYTIGSHPDGRRVAIACCEGASCHERLLAALLSRDGFLLDGLYRDGPEAGPLRAQLCDSLREQGFTFQTASLAAARELVSEGARRRSSRGLRQPRSLFLGRDLFSIYDEHLSPRRRGSREADLGALLSRGLEQLAIGDSRRARALLERYVRRAPRDAEGWAALGVCLLAIGQVEEAEQRLQRAAELDSKSSLALWNLAAAAHRGGHAESCYWALCRYLERNDDGEGAEQRREQARALIAEHERMMRLELSPSDRPPTD